MNHNWVNEIPTGKVDISVSLMQMKHGLHFSSHQKPILAMNPLNKCIKDFIRVFW